MNRNLHQVHFINHHKDQGKKMKKLKFCSFAFLSMVCLQCVSFITALLQTPNANHTTRRRSLRQARRYLQESMQNANCSNSRSGKKKAAARTNPDLFSQTTVSSGASIGNVSLGTMGSYHEFAVCIKVYLHISTYFSIFHLLFFPCFSFFIFSPSFFLVFFPSTKTCHLASSDICFKTGAFVPLC